MAIYVILFGKRYSNGTKLVMLAFSFRSKTKYRQIFPLYPEHWNTEEKCVKSTHPLHKKLNILIQKEIVDAEARLRDLQITGREITSNQVYIYSLSWKTSWLIYTLKYQNQKTRKWRFLKK